MMSTLRLWELETEREREVFMWVNKKEKRKRGMIHVKRGRLNIGFFWIQFHQLDISFEIPSSFNFLIQFHLTTRRNCQKSIKSDLICTTLISPTQYFSRFIFTILISFNSMISSFAFVTLLGTLINRPIPKYT